MASNVEPIAIPQHKQKVLRRVSGSIDSGAKSSHVSSFKHLAMSYGSCASDAPDTSSPSWPPVSKTRRESLMSAAFCEAEHTVVNVGNGDSVQLITCVKASQGFDWNQDMFLPSDYHMDNDLQHRPDPVKEIILTNEEIEKMMPS